MSLRDEMHSVAQGIIGSHEARAHEVADIRTAAHAQLTAAQARLREMDKACQATTQQLHRDLARAEEQRQKEARSRLGGIAADHAAAHQEWCHLNAAMHARRAGATATTQPPPPAAQKSSRAGGQGGKRSSPDPRPA